MVLGLPFVFCSVWLCVVLVLAIEFVLFVVFVARFGVSLCFRACTCCFVCLGFVLSGLVFCGFGFAGILLFDVCCLL